MEVKTFIKRKKKGGTTEFNTFQIYAHAGVLFLQPQFLSAERRVHA